MADKSKELTTTVKLENDRLLFEGIAEGNKPIAIDYIPPFSDKLGYTSLELMLLSQRKYTISFSSSNSYLNKG